MISVYQPELKWAVKLYIISCLMHGFMHSLSNLNSQIYLERGWLIFSGACSGLINIKRWNERSGIA